MLAIEDWNSDRLVLIQQRLDISHQLVCRVKYRLQ